MVAAYNTTMKTKKKKKKTALIDQRRNIRRKDVMLWNGGTEEGTCVAELRCSWRR